MIFHVNRISGAAEGDGSADWSGDRWQEFGRQVLRAHHRHGLGAQCACGSLMVYCPVIEAARGLGLPTDDPRIRAADSRSRGRTEEQR